MSLDDPRYLSGELVGVSKGLKWYYNPELRKRCQYIPGTEPKDYIPGMGVRKSKKN